LTEEDLYLLLGGDNMESTVNPFTKEIKDELRKDILESIDALNERNN